MHIHVLSTKYRSSPTKFSRCGPAAAVAAGTRPVMQTPARLVVAASPRQKARWFFLRTLRLAIVNLTLLNRVVLFLLFLFFSCFFAVRCGFLCGLACFPFVSCFFLHFAFCTLKRETGCVCIVVIYSCGRLPMAGAGRRKERDRWTLLGVGVGVCGLARCDVMI